MASSSENPPPDTETAVRLLEHGQELINQLRHLLLLQVPPGCLPDLVTWGLMEEISGSLGLALSVLKSWEPPLELCDQAAQSDRSPSPGDGLKSKSSSPKRKTPLMPKSDDDRRKRKQAYSSTMVTAAPYDDGYLWRKYGQKVISGAKHPRSYFRCTYNSEQGCEATKQVQQTDTDDPPMFLTIYTHEHTCKNGRSAPHVIVESTPAEQFAVSFVSRRTATPPQHLLSSQLGEKPENTYGTSTTPAGHALFSGSESLEAMVELWMDTPEVGEAQQTVTPPSPQISEMERLLDSLLGN